MTEYQILPKTGVVEVGVYQSTYGLVWVTQDERGHCETQLEGFGWVYPYKVTVETIERGFKERNQERAFQ